jgi:CxxC motif-containing protein
MTKKLTCILCPRGCTLNVGENLTVSGNSCPRGEKYAMDECTNPVRTVTATVRIANRRDTMLSVKTEAPVPKGKMMDVMARLRSITVTAPVTIGAVIVGDIFGTKIIATQKVD